LLIVPLLLTGALGCPNNRPDFLVAFLTSVDELDFGNSDTSLSLSVWKVDTSRIAPNFTVAGSHPWISVTPLAGNSDGPRDPVLVTVTVNRSLMNVGTNFGQVTISAPGVQPTTIEITAISRIKADFSISPSLPIVGQPVTFLNASSVAQGQPPITIFVWNFGDGSPVSTLQNPIHIYNNIGTFAVTLTVSNGVVADSRVILVGVSGTVGPTAEFTSGTQTPFVNQLVQFTDLSMPGTGTISNWLWDFGDGATSNLQHPAHMYSMAAAYNVYLVVTTEVGSDDELKVNYINVLPAPPMADFTVSDRTPAPGQTVNFTDISVPGTSPITSWLWDFGDGTSSILEDPSHIYLAGAVYTSAAFYTVSLTVNTAVGMDTEIKPNFIIVQQ
jgi:PKD repeat protein